MDSAPGGTRRYSLAPKKRGLGPMGVVLGLLVGAALIHLGWYLYERWRLTVAVDAIHARGEPVLIDDFKCHVIDDADNPVPVWREAAIAHGDDVLWALEPYEIQLPLTLRERLKFKEMVNDNAELFAKARQAAGRSGKPQWHAHFSTPSINCSHRELDYQETVSRALCMKSIEEHESGDDAEALEAVSLLLRQQRVLYAHRSCGGHATALRAGTAASCALWKIGPCGLAISPQVKAFQGPSNK
jgi:hypothetical protein